MNKIIHYRDALTKTVLILVINALLLLMICIIPTVVLCSDLPEKNNNENEAFMEEIPYSVTILISKGDQEVRLEKLSILVYNLNGSLVSSGVPDNTGSINVKLREGLYTVIVKIDNKAVSSQKIYINESKIVTIELQTHDIRVICVDRKGNYVQGALVFLYGLAGFSNESGVCEIWQLLGSARTDINGTASFDNIWSGIYKITVRSGKTIGEEVLEVNKSKCITVRCDKTSLEVMVVTSAPLEHPLSNACVLLQDSTGRLFLRGYTDDNGKIQFNNLYADNYTVFVDWLGTQVFSGAVDTRFTESLKIRTTVFKVSLQIKSFLGESLPYSKVSISKVIFARRTTSIVNMGEIEADKNGFVVLFLPFGTYELSCANGIYYGALRINLSDNYSGVIHCGVHLNTWILLLLLSFPLFILSLIIERNKLKKPLKYRRYQSMLAKLESMYSSGLVEYKIYRKLKEEYETKLMELGGRRRR